MAQGLECRVEQAARLDRFLAERFDLSRAQARRLIADGLVEVNGRPVAKGAALTPGDRVRVAPFDRPEDQAVIPMDHPTVVELARGEGWVMVNKPAGMAVHPLRPDETDTLLNAIACRYPQVQGVGEAGLRSGVAHRLDVETSGVVAVALSPEIWAAFREAFRSHAARKTYRALVHGRPAETGRETMPLRVVRHRPAHVAVGHGKGERACRLSWRARRHFTHAAELEIDLETGFLHQVRVMMAHLGHPLLGDRRYGRADDQAPRSMLHAASLELCGAQAACEPPSDYIQTLDRLAAGSGC